MAVDREPRFADNTLWIRSATTWSSPGCIIQAVTEIDVVPGPASLPRPPASPPSAILGLVRASSSATSSPVMCSVAGSQAMVSTGLLFERAVGSLPDVFTPATVDTRSAMAWRHGGHGLPVAVLMSCAAAQ